MSEMNEKLDAISKKLDILTGPWSGAFISAAGTCSIARSTGGILHAFKFMSTSTPSLTAYDNASGMSGTVIAQFDANTPVGTYVEDYTILNGVSIYATAGNAPIVKIVYKNHST